MPASAAEPGFALYVHWPFCRSKCPYCDFNSHVRESVDQARWATALETELDHMAARVGTGPPLTSIFFGGGTPSLMPPATVARIVERARRTFGFDPAIEITLEANPTSAEADRFAAFAAAGVNRLSMGLQALNDVDLKFLGREHSVAEAIAAFRIARQTFGRVSFDLIYARPGMTAALWRDELRRALDLAVDHLSLYQLTIEANTGFAGRHARGEFALPAEETQAELFEITAAVTASAGLLAYEISNHARPGAESRHNLTYWRYGDYLGVGPGAHGRIHAGGRRIATRQSKKPEAWLEAVEAQGHGTEAEETISPAEAADEMLMMGLRLVEGVDLARLERVAGAARETLLPTARTRPLVDAGLLWRDDARIGATASGRRVLNPLLGRLLAG